MCALISQLREAEMGGTSHKYSQAVLKGESGLHQQQTSQTFWHSAFVLLQDGYFPSAMRGHFSIEWMAQSSQSTGTDALPGTAACGTHSESLPGFYCRQKSEIGPEANRNQSLKSLNQHQLSHSNQGMSRLVQNICDTQSFKVSFNVNINRFTI